MDLLTRLLFAVVKWYRRVISPLYPPTCRFSPSCSSYALQALEKYGWARGGVLSLFRLLKCHPFHPGGKDPLR
ncbi:membrane protein insertion efficiency factor YidD [bacterium]|nr:membrane protein insertion efficiency factor YidD [bacterium]